MNKTFDSAFDDSNFKLHVGRVFGADNFVVDISGGGYSRSMAIAPSDAPALCLAILEAAGVEARMHSYPVEEGETPHLEFIADQLKSYVKRAEKIAAAEADRVALEQEALKLMNALRKSVAQDTSDDWDDAPEAKHRWLAVAQAARELNKETPDA